MSIYAKFLVALFGFLVLVLNHYFGPDNFFSQAVVSLATSLGVFAVPNRTTVAYRRDTNGPVN